MKFALDYQVDVGDATIDAAMLQSQLDQHRDTLSDVSQLYGAVRIILDGQVQDLDYADPLVRLADQWVRKIPWIISGDTETLALRDSEQCFAFMPTGDSVELSFYNGTESEVEDYVLEPTIVRAEVLVPEILRVGEEIVALVKSLDAGALESDEDCRDLATSVAEAQRAWKDHLRRQRF